MKLKKVSKLNGVVTVPGDKSVSHRAVMFGSISEGLTEVTNFLQGADCLATISCFKQMGIKIENTDKHIYIHGKGLHGLTAPKSVLDIGNSGTSIRLISGLLSAQNFNVTLTGDASIQTRPMKRIIEPLSLMGASIYSQNNNGCAPLSITGKALKGIHYTSKVASAQVKSAILLAGLYADSPTYVTEPYISRNHTEIMLKYLGAHITTSDTTVSILPNPILKGKKIKVPGDISSAAYFIAAGLIVPNSELLIKNVGINPTRNGILQVAKNMGGNITLLNENYDDGEATADILVKSSDLHGTTISGSLIPTLIDEIPIIAVMAAYAGGTTVIKDAAELKVKESNRIDVMVSNLSAMGCDISGTDDGMIIEGGKQLTGAVIDSVADHRIAMSFAIAALQADGITELLGSDSVNVSYPGFFNDLENLY